MYAGSNKSMGDLYQHRSETWNSGNLAYTQRQVSSLINYCSALTQQLDATEPNEFILDRIGQLEQLQRMLVANENSFYKEFGVSNIKGLQEAVNEVDEFLGGAFVNGDEVYKQIIKEAGGKDVKDLTKPATLFFEDKGVRKCLTNYFGNSFGQITVDELVQALNNVVTSGNSLQPDVKDNSKGRFIGTNSSDRGLQTLLGTIYYDPKGAEYQLTKNKRKGMTIQVKLNEMFPKYYVDKLKGFYGIRIQYENGELIEVIKRIVLKNVDAKYKRYVENEIVNNINNYDLYSGASSIAGFLGEVRNNVVLNILYNRANSSKGYLARATGNVRNMKNQEISIDSIFRDYGFQVKNYSVVNGSVGFGNFRENNEAMSMRNFIDNRMRADSISEALYSLYGAYQYNQPIQEAKGFEGYRNSIEYLAEKGVIPLVESYADNIIKVTDEFSSTDQDFIEEGVYFNTFFVVGKNYIPSSEIIGSLIETLANMRQKKIVNLDYYQVFNSSSPVYMEPATLDSALNQVKVKYKISVDIQTVIEQALSKISA